MIFWVQQNNEMQKWNAAPCKNFAATGAAQKKLLSNKPRNRSQLAKQITRA